MTDLRAALIEAMGHFHYDDDKLDAVLGVLADRASCSSYEAAIRTHGKSPAVCSHTTLDGLIAVLRGDTE